MLKKFEGKTIKNTELKHACDEETEVSGEIIRFTFTDESHIDLMCDPVGCDERVQALFVEVTSSPPFRAELPVSPVGADGWFLLHRTVSYPHLHKPTPSVPRR